MCQDQNEKWKRQITEGIEPPNQERIRTFGEKNDNTGSRHHQTSRD